MFKSITYNSDRKFLNIALSSFCISLIFVAYLLSESISSYPPYIISSFGIIAILILISKKFGLISVTSLLSIILLAPSLSPFFTHVLFKAAYYSWLNRSLQEDINLVNKTCFIIFLASVIYCIILLSFTNRKQFQTNSYNVIHFNFGKASFVGLCCLFLFSVWLTDPGPPLLFVDYTTMLQARYESTQFSGAFVVIFWCLAFMTYRNYKKSILTKFFQIITFIGIAWLLLHARRSELLGILIIILLHFAEKGSPKKVIVFGALSLFCLTLIGNIRDVAILSQSMADILHRISVVREAKFGEVASMPGGASNIFVTMLDSVYLIDVMNYGFLNGRTYFQYIYNMIPLNLIKLLKLPEPTYFFHILDQFFQYGGGTYIFAPAYANFGVFGVIFIAIFLGKIVIFSHKNFKSRSFFLQGVSLIIVANFARGVWYEPIPIMKCILAFGALTLILYSCGNKTGRNQVLTTIREE